MRPACVVCVCVCVCMCVMIGDDEALPCTYARFLQCLTSYSPRDCVCGCGCQCAMQAQT